MSVFDDPRMENQSEMSSPVMILEAFISTVPITSEPKMSSSLTWNVKLFTGCANGIWKCWFHLGLVVFLMTRVRATVTVEARTWT